MSALDELFRNIADLRAELDGLAPDDFERRVEVRSKIAELHAEAYHLEEELPPDRQHLEAELRELMDERAAIINSHVDPVAQSGSLGASVPGDTSGAQDLNRAMDSAADLQRIERHISKIKHRLGIN